MRRRSLSPDREIRGIGRSRKYAVSGMRLASDIDLGCVPRTENPGVEAPDILKSRVTIGNLTFDERLLEDLCKRWRIERLEAFGSVLRADFASGSDVDLLATYEPGVKYGFLDQARLETELESLLGRKVDLAEPHLLKWVIRERVLKEAQVVFAA